MRRTYRKICVTNPGLVLVIELSNSRFGHMVRAGNTGMLAQLSFSENFCLGDPGKRQLDTVKRYLQEIRADLDSPHDRKKMESHRNPPTALMVTRSESKQPSLTSAAAAAPPMTTTQQQQQRRRSVVGRGYNITSISELRDLSDSICHYYLNSNS